MKIAIKNNSSGKRGVLWKIYNGVFMAGAVHVFYLIKGICAAAQKEYKQYYLKPGCMIRRKSGPPRFQWLQDE